MVYLALIWAAISTVAAIIERRRAAWHRADADAAEREALQWERRCLEFEQRKIRRRFTWN